MKSEEDGAGGCRVSSGSCWCSPGDQMNCYFRSLIWPRVTTATPTIVLSKYASRGMTGGLLKIIKSSPLIPSYHGPKPFCTFLSYHPSIICLLLCLRHVSTWAGRRANSEKHFKIEQISDPNLTRSYFNSCSTQWIKLSIANRYILHTVQYRSLRWNWAGWINICYL